MKVLFIIVSLAFAVSAQTSTFKWETELCVNQGTYDSGKYTEEQLRNTVRLFHPGEFDYFPKATVWRYSEIAEIDHTESEKVYKARSEELRALKIVDLPYWEDLRQQKLRRMKENYELARVTLRAYTQPEILRTIPDAEACKLNFAEPIIAGGQTLIDAWRKVNKDSQTRNADPDRLQRRFDEQNASPDRLKYALVETMAFGWFNCVNATFDHEEGDPYSEFEKLFKKVSSECGQP